MNKSKLQESQLFTVMPRLPGEWRRNSTRGRSESRACLIWEIKSLGLKMKTHKMDNMKMIVRLSAGEWQGDKEIGAIIKINYDWNF